LNSSTSGEGSSSEELPVGSFYRGSSSGRKGLLILGRERRKLACGFRGGLGVGFLGGVSYIFGGGFFWGGAGTVT